MAVPHEHVAALWREFERLPFPPRLTAVEVDGVDLVVLDTYLAGHISSWLGSRDGLDPGRRRVLREHLDAIHRVVLPALTDPTEHQYYSALADCVQAVLTAER